MPKRFCCYLLIILVSFATAASLLFYTGHSRQVQPTSIPASDHISLNIVLIPLDSRPPCTQFVTQLARVADIRLIMPPPELLDYYKTPANKTALRAWLKDAVKNADAAIISTDMLIHGGLLASRFAYGTSDDVRDTLQLIADIHQSNPQVKLYAFNIIPRLLIADSADNALYQKKMLNYSLLKDEILTFENPLDVEKLTKIEYAIAPGVIDHYLTLNEANAAVNLELVHMAEQGVITGLVLGQDDGQPFGLPNITKNRLSTYVSKRPGLAKRVFITRGTDEVAMMLLGQIAVREANRQPKVFVKYSHADAPGIVMPYMPHSVARTVQEKIAMVNGLQTQTPEEADFILYVHIGTHQVRTSTLTAAARDIKQLLQAGYQVALVDLSEHFYGHQTLLPYLLKEDAAVTRLIAYAGWNTTSNSIGSAVTQATVFNLVIQKDRSLPYLLRAYHNNLVFLTARLLDDWYYQKEVQQVIKTNLRNVHLDAYNLKDQHQQVNSLVSRMMSDRAAALWRKALINQPLYIDSEDGRKELTVIGLQVESELPWPRIFEVRLTPTLSLAVEDVRQ